MNRILLFCFSILMSVMPLNGKYVVTARCSLESGSVEDMPVQLYRVGDIFTRSGFHMDEPYVGIASPNPQDPVSLKECAQALYARVLGSGYEPAFTGVVRENGSILFQDVPMGTYLMASEGWQKDNVIYRVVPVLVNVDSDVDIEIKIEMEPVIPEEKMDVSVVKRWVLSEEADPVPITVQLLRNGTPVDSIQLDDSNYWCYTWTDLDPGSIWTVSEAAVPEGFVAELTREDRLFMLTNTAITYLKVNPQTGVWLSQPLGFVFILMAILVAITIVILQKRKDEKHEKER